MVRAFQFQLVFLGARTHPDLSAGARFFKFALLYPSCDVSRFSFSKLLTLLLFTSIPTFLHVLCVSCLPHDTIKCASRVWPSSFPSQGMSVSQCSCKSGWFVNGIYLPEGVRLQIRSSCGVCSKQNQFHSFFFWSWQEFCSKQQKRRLTASIKVMHGGLNYPINVLAVQ